MLAVEENNFISILFYGETNYYWVIMLLRWSFSLFVIEV